ncbi:DUF2167 domain-containing protein [Achromobacter sp.]|uniref:DUF2167 domain-containing protein n=1 Tax=Achromobacter sp. TaxID=134375 RepID=UPI00289704F0|nr:DUF2167 domain-containing protein [Achromobacter sp.]
MQINQKPETGMHSKLVRLLQRLRDTRSGNVFHAASITKPHKVVGFRFVISFLLAFLLCIAAPTYAAPTAEPARAKPAKPLTFKEALSAELEILRNPMVKMILDRGGSIGDGKLLEVIDQAQQAGKAGELPDVVIARLEVWRKERAIEEAYRKAPWVHGPARVAIKGPVYLQVPKGFKYLAPEAVELLPHGYKTLSSRALVSNDDDTFAAFVMVSEPGHFTPGQLALNADSILHRIQDKFTNPLRNATGFMDIQHGIVAKPEWIDPPHFDNERHVVSWSYTEPRPTSPRMFAVRLGKTWAAEFQVISPGDSDTETPIMRAQKVAAAIEFSPGEDYDNADTRTPKAAMSMIDVIGGQEFKFIPYIAPQPSTWETIKSPLLRVAPLLLLIIALILQAMRSQKKE